MSNTRYFYQILKKRELFRQTYEEISNIKFHHSMPSGSRVVPYRQTGEHMGGRTDMTQLIVAFRNFAKSA